jgi:hypothetical protein
MWTRLRSWLIQNTLFLTRTPPRIFLGGAYKLILSLKSQIENANI